MYADVTVSVKGLATVAWHPSLATRSWLNWGLAKQTRRHNSKKRPHLKNGSPRWKQKTQLPQKGNRAWLQKKITGGAEPTQRAHFKA